MLSFLVTHKKLWRSMKRRRGRKETILTGPLGIQETEEEALETLLGKKD